MSYLLGLSSLRPQYSCKPITRLFNCSITMSVVPSQWKTAYIRPVRYPKFLHLCLILTTDQYPLHQFYLGYNGKISGSSLALAGPASYVVNSSDLTAVKPGNLLCKYADDTYLIIPSINVDTKLDELANVENWSRRNNLTLKCSKS